MTVIVGIVEDGKIYMGGDSCVSFGWHVEQHAEPKVWRADDFLIGVAGDHRLCNILRHQYLPPTQDADAPDDYYVISKFTDGLRLRTKELGYSMVDNNQEKISSGEILLGYRGKLYQIGVDFAVVRNSTGLAAIGSGYPFALGAMIALGDVPPEKRVMQALEIAARFSYGVDRKFNIEVVQA